MDTLIGENSLLVNNEVAVEAKETDSEEMFGPIYNEKGEELLFENGPTVNEIEEWKSRFKDIYFTEFEDEVIIWRCIMRSEYKDIQKIQGADSYYKEERLCEACVLFPKNYNFQAMRAGKAGIPSFISEQILEKSGFAARAAAIKL